MQLRVGLVCILVAGVSPAKLFAQSTGAFGDPLPGLSDDELERFDTGLDEFAEIESIEEGVGPIFNGRSCVECHSAPEVGGGADSLETRFGTTKRGKFDDLDELGGSLIQAGGIGTEAGCDPEVDFVGEVVPAQATIRAKRRATPLFGLGLVDGVPESTIIALAIFQAHEHRSTAGTVSRVQSIALGRKVVGKFGWKAQNPTLFQFSGDAYVNELGITSPEFPDENCPNGDCALIEQCNPSVHPGRDTDDDGSNVQGFADFMTLLGAPPRGEITDDVKAGEREFARVGCDDCHVSTLKTGKSPIDALSRVKFHPYSDFLLHDMGRLGDGIQQNNATGELMRTAPLWGLRKITTFLHDGRAKTVRDAIIGHAGQGARARDAFLDLSKSRQRKLLAFLGSL